MPNAGADDCALVLGVGEGVLELVLTNPVPKPLPKPVDGVVGIAALRALGLNPNASDVDGADGT